jgi:hypothetical protein
VTRNEVVDMMSELERARKNERRMAKEGRSTASEAQ